MDNKVIAEFTVFFEQRSSFWVGIYQREHRGKLEACRIVFGAEPKDYQVYEFLLKHWKDLRFSPPTEGEGHKKAPLNPKRIQREVRRRMESQSFEGTKAQQALALQREAQKQEKKASRRARDEAEKLRQFELRQQKRKEKHRGR